MSTLSISFPSLPVRSSPQISPPRPWHRGEVHSPVLQIASQPLLGAHGQEEPQRATVAALTSTAAEVFQAPSSFSCSSRCSFTSRTMAGWSFLKPQNMSRFHRKPTGFPRVLTGHAHMAPWPWPTWPVTLAHTTRDPGTHAPWPRPTWPVILAYTIRDPGPHDPVTLAHTTRDPGPQHSALHPPLLRRALPTKGCFLLASFNLGRNHLSAKRLFLSLLEGLLYFLSRRPASALRSTLSQPVSCFTEFVFRVYSCAAWKQTQCLYDWSWNSLINMWWVNE